MIQSSLADFSSFQVYMPLSKENFAAHCSVIVSKRSAAIALLSQHRYAVYLDLESGYPQVKIIASQASDYETMDTFLEDVSNIINDNAAFAIHDNYSHYEEYNDYSYTIPLTHANMHLLRTLFIGKEGFRLIGNAYEALKQRLKEEYRHCYTKSLGYQTYKLLEHYASWETGEHLYSQFTEMGLHHIEKLRSLQKSTLSDPHALVFITDEDEPILNDILTDLVELQDIIDSNVIKDYLARYRLEISYSKSFEDKNSAIEALSSSEDILLCGVLLDNPNATIFAPYTMRVIQCLNEVYRMQVRSNSLQSRIQSDPDIKDLVIPKQTQLLTLMGSHGRWVIDGSETLQGRVNPSHCAWQCGVHYKAIDEATAQLLLLSGFEYLSQQQYANALTCLPYDVFKLFILCFNLSNTEDIDLKEIYLSCTEKIIEARLVKGLPIPEIVIHEIRKMTGSTDCIKRCQAANQAYYQRWVFPVVMQELLENVQICITNWQQEQTGPDSDEIIGGAGYYTFVYDTDTNQFVPIVIAKDGQEQLLTAILALKNPLDFTMQMVCKFDESLTSQHRCSVDML